MTTVGEIVRPGDYCGPLSGYTGDRIACFFRLPIEAPQGGPPDERSLRHVTFPPHSYRECDDGSVEIRESIGAHHCPPRVGYLWHGYLDEGHVWREC